MLRGVLVWERRASYNIAAAGLDLEMTRDMFLPSKAQSLAPKKTVTAAIGASELGTMRGSTILAHLVL